MARYEVKTVSYNWEERIEIKRIATDFSFDNATTLRVVVEGKKRPVLIRDYCVEEIVITNLETNEVVLTFKGTNKPQRNNK